MTAKHIEIREEDGRLRLLLAGDVSPTADEAPESQLLRAYATGETLSIAGHPCKIVRVDPSEMPTLLSVTVAPPEAETGTKTPKYLPNGVFDPSSEDAK